MNFFNPFDFPSYSYSPRHQHPHQQHQHRSNYYRDPYGQREDSGFFPSNINLEALRRERELEELQRERQRNAYYAREAERQREAELQEQYLRQRKEALRRKEYEQQEALRKRRILLLTYTIAAKKIQRAFRAYREKELKKEQERSAIVLQRAFQKFHAKLEGIRLQNKMKELAKYNSELFELNGTAGKRVLSSSVFGDNGQLTKDYLFYEDALLKLILKLDGVTTDGFDIVRERRKELVQKINASFKKLDIHKKECEKNNMQVDKKVIQDEEMKEEGHHVNQHQDEEMKEVQRPQAGGAGKRHKKKKASKHHQKLKPMELEETTGINLETTGK